MDDAGLNSKLEKPAPLAANSADALAATFGDTFDRTSAMLNSGLRFWQAESLRFLNEAAVDSRTVAARLSQCKTPLDVVSVQHDWLRARSRSFLEARVRFIDALAAPARSAATADEQGAEPHKTPEAAV